MEADMNIHIADNIRTLRRKNDYTLEQLAEIIDVSRQTIAKWEIGETLPDIANCVKMATLFKVTLDEFVTMQVDRPEKMADDSKNGRVMGIVDVETDGRIIIPDQIRDLFEIQSGEKMLLLADKNQGIAIVKCSQF